MKKLSLSLLICASLFVLAGQALCFAAQTSEAAHTSAAAAGGTAVIIVTEGSTRADARKIFLDFEQSVIQAHPDLTVRRAYSLPAAREAVRGTAEETPSLAGALSLLTDAGYSKIAILAAVTLPGREYEDIKSTAAAFTSLAMQSGKRINIEVSLPLLGSEEDIYSASAALMDHFPAESRNGEAVLFVGQAESGLGSLSYPALSWGLFRQGKRGSLYLATFLDNTEGLKDSLNIMQMNKIKTVHLVSLLTLPDNANQVAIFGPNAQEVIPPQALTPAQTTPPAPITPPDLTAQSGQPATVQVEPMQPVAPVVPIAPVTPIVPTTPPAMAGPDTSIAAALAKAGFEIVPKTSGLLANPLMANIWRAKLQQSLDKLATSH